MIRLQRIGRKKSPVYRFVINEKARDTQARNLEILGQYNPTRSPKVLEMKTDRITYWLGKGAQMSNTVHNLLVKEGIVAGDKKKSVRITIKRQGKLDQKKAAEAEAKKAAEEAIKAAEEAKKAAKAAEARSEETPAPEGGTDAPPEEKKE